MVNFTALIKKTAPNFLKIFDIESLCMYEGDCVNDKKMPEGIAIFQLTQFIEKNLVMIFSKDMENTLSLINKSLIGI